MKKIASITLLAAVVLFVPVAAEAQSCYMNFCDWMVNGDFTSTTGWTGTGTFPTIADPCLSGAPQNKIGQVWTSQWLKSPTMFIDTEGDTSNFEVSFNLYLVDDTDNWYDQLKISVKNTTTNQTETFYIRGDSYDTQCSDVVLTLNNDYNDDNVYVKFEVNSLAIGKYQIDNVSFWTY